MKMKMNQRIDESMKQSIDDEVIEGDWLGGYIVLYYCDSASVRVASIYLPTAVVIASKDYISKTRNGRFWTWQRSRPLPTSGGGLRTRLSRHDRGSFNWFARGNGRGVWSGWRNDEVKTTISRRERSSTLIVVQLSARVVCAN